MKIRTVFAFDREDLAVDKALLQAINCMGDLMPELQGPEPPRKEEPHPARKSLNRIEGNSFELSDVTVIRVYCHQRIDAAREKYNGPYANAPWRDAVLSACDSLEFKVGEFDRYVREQFVLWNGSP